jgi:hypothetical protein
MALNIERMHDLDAICVHCGKPWSEHLGEFCPDVDKNDIISGTKFFEERKILQKQDEPIFDHGAYEIAPKPIKQ